MSSNVTAVDTRYHTTYYYHLCPRSLTSSSLLTLKMFAPLVADKDTNTAPVQDGPGERMRSTIRC